MVEAEAHRCAREGFEEPVLIRRRGNFEGEFLHQTKMLHCDRPVAGTFPTRRSREPLPGSPVPVPLRHGRQMGHYATGPGPRRGGLLPWPLLRDGDRLPVLIDWPETGKARAPDTDRKRKRLNYSH